MQIQQLATIRAYGSYGFPRYQILDENLNLVDDNFSSIHEAKYFAEKLGYYITN